MYRRQLALSVSTRGEAVLLLSRWGLLRTGRRSYVFKGYGTFDVLASEHGGILPLYEYANVRGHGRITD